MEPYYLMSHELKCLPEYFQAVLEGNKQFEVRTNDRDYKLGDLLVLNEYDPDNGFTGRRCKREVKYILSDPAYVKEGFVIMSMSDVISVGT